MIKKILNKKQKVKIVLFIIAIVIMLFLIYGILIWNFFTEYAEFQENYYNEINNIIERK